MKRSRAALLILIAAFGVPPTNAQELIIDEQDTPIHTIFTSVFDEWPGTTGIAPIDVVATPDRIWLVWPEALISLRSDGSADSETLLSYFNSRNALETEQPWFPSFGAICSDGLWRGIDRDKDILWTKNPVSGEVSERKLHFHLNSPPAVYPIHKDSLLVSTGSQAYLVNNERERNLSGIDTTWTLSTLRATASESGALAWWDADSQTIELRWLPPLGDSLSGDMNHQDTVFLRRINANRSLNAKLLPGLPQYAPKALCWVGQTLVCGYNDSIFAVDLDKQGTPALNVFSDIPLPERWYRLRGTTGMILLDSPGSGRVLVYNSTSHPIDPVLPITEEPVFDNLLHHHLLESADQLLALGQIERAELLYAWALPLIRDRRSRDVLAEHWPVLENEIYKRRSRLRTLIENP